MFIGAFSALQSLNFAEEPVIDAAGMTLINLAVFVLPWI